MKKKKPNYKLRRNVAKVVIVLIILLPIILINKTKIMHAPVYLQNIKYSKMIDAFFDSDYTTDETIDILDKLKKKKIVIGKSLLITIEFNFPAYSFIVIDCENFFR